MENKDKERSIPNIDRNKDKEVGNEYTRRPNNDFDSSPKGEEDRNDISRDDLERKDSGSMGSPSPHRE
ncbi:MAG TPA: hypothetical protein VGQ76_26050 [Thermoanaerobaculia bacterium]|jgi:hypothetical protein|nr:hypothetical protein [Thermoanaerobaculia bacterium]